MKRAFLVFIILSLFTLTGTYEGHAQTYEVTPVEISTEKVKINGQIFYAHKVLKKQTLYSISKKYGVPVEEIYTYNEEARKGIKEGSFLYIPVKEPDSSHKGMVPEDTQKNAPEGNGQPTVSSLSRKELRQLTCHRVKWYETLEDIASRYKVDKEKISAFNELTDTDISNCKYLYIPDDSLFQEEQKRQEEGTKAEKKEKKKTSYKKPVPSKIIIHEKPVNDVAYSYGEDRSYRISVILPLNVTDSSDHPSPHHMDFYAGILTALKDLSAQYDLSAYTLKVIDQTRYASSEELIAEGELEGSELIIGPILSKDIAPVAEYARKKQIPIVSPLDTRSEIYVEGNPYFFLYPVLNERITDSMLEHFTEDHEMFEDQLYVSTGHISRKVSDYVNFLRRYDLREDSYSHVSISSVLDSLALLPVLQEDSIAVLEMSDSLTLMQEKRLDLQKELIESGHTRFQDLFWDKFQNCGLDITADSLNSRFCHLDLIRYQHKMGNQIAVAHPRGLRNLLIMNKEEKHRPYVRSVVRGLNEKHAVYDSLSYNILEGRGIDSLMFFKMDTLGHNRVMIVSEDEAFISDALRNLYLLQSAEGISVEVHGLPKWRNYNTMELKNFHALNTHLTLSTDVYASDSAVHHFIQEYRSIFKTDPSAYSFRGYDIASYFLSALCEYGREFPNFIEGKEYPHLQTNVKFIKAGAESGFRNEATKIILFAPDWEIKTL